MEDEAEGSPTYNKTTATAATAIDDNDGERTFFHYCYDCYCCRSRRNEWRHPWRHHGGRREMRRCLARPNVCETTLICVNAKPGLGRN